MEGIDIEQQEPFPVDRDGRPSQRSADQPDGEGKVGCCGKFQESVSKWMLPEDARSKYLERANCCPPPIFIILISIAEVLPRRPLRIPLLHAAFDVVMSQRVLGGQMWVPPFATALWLLFPSSFREMCLVKQGITLSMLKSMGGYNRNKQRSCLFLMSTNQSQRWLPRDWR